MAQITLKGNPLSTNGDLPAIGTEVSSSTLVKSDLSTTSIQDYRGSKVVLNIFPSIDTGTCATSVRTFNAKATELENTKVLCISRDLPFAMARFCGAEGIENVETLSDYQDGSFSKSLGLQIENGPLVALAARAIVVLDENGKIKHTELVSEVVDEPNYEAALSALN